MINLIYGIQLIKQYNLVFLFNLIKLKLKIFLLIDWAYDIGFVSEDMIAKHLPPPGDDTIILMCGPPPMIKFACNPNLDKLGYKTEMRFSY